LRIIRIEISNFRGIKQLRWHPTTGTNCLVGVGDSGKTSVLDAIELVFAARSGVSFDDTDFYAVDPKANPITVTVTFGDPPAEFLKGERYGLYARGWNEAAQELEDEPDEETQGLENVLSIRLTVDHTLEPEWTLFNERVDKGELNPRPLIFQDSQDIAPSRLGPYADRHLNWGRQSVLNRITNGASGSRGLLAEAGRVARQEFSKDSKRLFADTIDQVKVAAQRLGVPIRDDLQAMLDVQAIGLSSGGISLHDKDLPLRRLGLGSARLFVAALQDQARANASVALIDEIEHGLEPNRISRLLRQLKLTKEKDKPKAQVFMTTHSPVVLQELSVGELHIVRRDANTGEVVICPAQIEYKSLDPQTQPRTNPQAYLAPSVLICEGKTEVGLMRGLDDFWSEEGKLSFATLGVVPVSGGGVDKAPKIAGYFRSLGYQVGLLLDSDREPADTDILRELHGLGVSLFRWETGHATEDHLFRDLPKEAVVRLIQAALVNQPEQSIVDRINTKLPERRFSNIEDIKAVADNNDVRIALGELAKARDRNDPNERGWFKDISVAERIGRRLVGPNLGLIEGQFAETVAIIRTWVDREQ
jgi:putative ATP-dependent endonuclease of OLD family